MMMMISVVLFADVRRKRPPKRLSQRPNDIYINRKSDFSSQLARCHKLLDQGLVSVCRSWNHTHTHTLGGVWEGWGGW